MKDVVVVACALLLSAGCEKSVCGDCFDAVVTWGGEPAADGIGWYLRPADTTQNRIYKVESIPEGYLKHGKPVEACIVLTDKTYPCFCAAPLPVYRLQAIRSS